MIAPGIGDLDQATVDAILDETATLAAIPSASGDEGPIADYVEAQLRWIASLSVVRIENTVVASSAPARASDRADRLLLAGHVDTVPPTDPPQPVVRGARHVTGRGVVDMKGGVAVLLHLARHVVGTARVPCTLVLYEGEELGSHRSGMRMLAESRPDLLEAGAGILLEPTGGWIELGCQGNIRISAVYHGVAAHTARAWRGVNAVRRAAPDIARCAAHHVAEVAIGDHVYPQALEIVAVAGGARRNTVPDRCEIEVNARYAPNRRRDDVLDEVCGLFADADEITVTLDSPAALPATASALLAPLVREASIPHRPKLGWTDVGRLAELGIPAINFGPGDPELAHGPHEQVSGEDLCHVFQRIRDLIR